MQGLCGGVLFAPPEGLLASVSMGGVSVSDRNFRRRATFAAQLQVCGSVGYFAPYALCYVSGGMSLAKMGWGVRLFP